MHASNRPVSEDEEENNVFSRRPLYYGRAGSDVIGCCRPTNGVFYICILQARVTLTAFPIVTPRDAVSRSHEGELLHYSWGIVLWKCLNNIMKVKQQRNEYVQVWSVSRCLLLGEKKIPINSISLLSVFVFPTCLLEGDRAGSWWKLFIFLDEAGLTWPRGGGEVESPAVERDSELFFSVGLRPPSTYSFFLLVGTIFIGKVYIFQNS